MDAQEANLYNAILISSVVIGIIIIFFIISITRQQRKNLELHRANILAELHALDKERSRIAHDLHDELGPLLAAVKMKINSFELTDEEDIVQVHKTNLHIDEILKKIREISFDLMPGSLLRKGLVPAIKEFIDYMENDEKVNFHFSVNGDVDISETKAINIYRMVQEIVHNALKHSGASEVSLTITTEVKKVTLVIKDNGKGFNQKESLTSVGFGLRGLLSRTEMIGGLMYLDTKPGQGTIYTFEIPLL